MRTALAFVIVAGCSARVDAPPEPRGVRAAHGAYVRAFASWRDQVCACDLDPARCVAEFERTSTPRAWTPCHARAAARHEAVLTPIFECLAAVFADPQTCPTAACLPGCMVSDASCRSQPTCRTAAEATRACTSTSTIPDDVEAALSACDQRD